MTKILGNTAPAYEHVADIFRENFQVRDERGAAYCIYHKGQLVVNIWAGEQQEEPPIPWSEDTVVVVFSAIKGITAICILQLVEQRLLSLDCPISRYWPEFAGGGKNNITLGMVLSHRAGIPVIDGNFTLEEVYSTEAMVAALERQEPIWPPGSQHGYHVRTFGWILAEVIRRVTGASLGEYLRDNITGPLDIPLWIGIGEEQLPHVARIITPETGNKNLIEQMGADSLMVRAMCGPSNLFDYNDMWNSLELLQAELPSSNGVCSAHGLAKVYASLIGDGLDGFRLLEPETVELARTLRSSGPDAVIVMESNFGFGFCLPPMLAPNCGVNSFGHPGAGGSTAFADPDAELAIAYTTSRMRVDAGPDPRAQALLAATYECAAEYPLAS